MSKKTARYGAYTLAEVLVVLMVIIILGSIGAYSFGGLRDTVLVKQNIEEIKQDLQLIQQKAMLLEKSQGEGWIYGIGIDFSDIENGRYTFIKWCSPFSSYGDVRTRSEIVAYNPERDIGEADPPYGLNAVLPVAEELQRGGYCDPAGASQYVTNMPGIEEGKINMGFDISLLYPASYIVFEAVTGRVFLYDEQGIPVNYNSEGEFQEGDENVLGIIIHRNRGNKSDIIRVLPLSGAVDHTIVDN